MAEAEEEEVEIEEEFELVEEDDGYEGHYGVLAVVDDVVVGVLGEYSARTGDSGPLSDLAAFSLAFFRFLGGV